MKIGIITTTFFNYGTRLQNLATVELCKKEYPGAKVETIVISQCKNKFLNLLPSFLYSFIYKRTHFRGKINKNNNLLRYKIYRIKNWNIDNLYFLNKKYDLFVIGSDQIWCYTDETRFYKYGMFTEPNKKVCNAPSMRITDKLDLELLKPMLSSFKQLNVREQNAADFINNELKIPCSALEDPTLRLTKEEWSKYIGNNLKLPANYVLVYILNSEDKCDEICSKITKNVIKIFNVNNGRSVFDFTPIEFIEIVKNAEAVVTNSFHGSCFSKIFNKKLFIVKDDKILDHRYEYFDDYEKKVNSLEEINKE